MTREFFRAYRKSKGWSQARLADELGLTKMHISNMERGVYPIGGHARYAMGMLMVKDALDSRERPEHIGKIITEIMSR